MPTAKKKITKKTVAKKIKKPVNDVKESKPMASNVCRSCNALPAGSIELVSLLLVLVFALSAVLVTSVYALNQQSAELAALQVNVGE